MEDGSCNLKEEEFEEDICPRQEVNMEDEPGCSVAEAVATITPEAPHNLNQEDTQYLHMDSTAAEVSVTLEEDGGQHTSGVTAVAVATCTSGKATEEFQFEFCRDDSGLPKGAAEAVATCTSQEAAEEFQFEFCPDQSVPPKGAVEAAATCSSEDATEEFQFELCPDEALLPTQTAYLQFSKTRNGRCLVLDDYRYVRNKTRNGVMYWRCTQAGCKVYVKTSMFDVHAAGAGGGGGVPTIQLLSLPGRHDHESDAELLATAALVEQMMQLVDADPTRPNKSIYQQVLSQAPDASAMPPFQSVKSSLQRRKSMPREKTRRKSMPPCETVRSQTKKGKGSRMPPDDQMPPCTGTVELQLEKPKAVAPDKTAKSRTEKKKKVPSPASDVTDVPDVPPCEAVETQLEKTPDKTKTVRSQLEKEKASPMPPDDTGRTQAAEKASPMPPDDTGRTQAAEVSEVSEVSDTSPTCETGKSQRGRKKAMSSRETGRTRTEKRKASPVPPDETGKSQTGKKKTLPPCETVKSHTVKRKVPSQAADMSDTVDMADVSDTADMLDTADMPSDKTVRTRSEKKKPMPSDKSVNSRRGKKAAMPPCKAVKSRLGRKKTPQSKAVDESATPPDDTMRTRQGRRRRKASLRPAGNQEEEMGQEQDEMGQEDEELGQEEEEETGTAENTKKNTKKRSCQDNIPSTATSNEPKAYLRHANRQGARCLVLDDYRYVRNKTRNGVMYWRCAQAGCCVYLKTNVFDVLADSDPHIKVLHQTGRHRHLAKTNQLSRTALIEHMLQLVEADPSRPTKRIYDQVLASAAEEDAASMPSFDSVRSRLERRRSSLRPCLPDDAQQVPVAVETWNGDNFLSEHHGDHGYLLFTTETNITRLAQCTQVYIDGAFGGCPRPFQQLVTVRGLYWEQPIAFVMVLMSGNAEEMYRAVLKHIQHRVQTLTGQQWCPEVVTADLEVALFKALRGELLAAQVSSCSYHFYQSLRRKVQELDLAGAYQSDGRVRRWLRRVMAVAFLPRAVARQSFREVAVSEETTGLVGEHPALGDLIRYLEQTYLGERALFPPHIWNAYGRRHDNTDNNHVEAFHQRWNSAIDSRHPSLWVLIRRLKDEQRQVEAQCVMVESGGAPCGQKRKWRQLEQKMQQLQSQQQSGEKTVEEYWDAVQTLMGNFE